MKVSLRQPPAHFGRAFRWRGWPRLSSPICWPARRPPHSSDALPAARAPRMPSRSVRRPMRCMTARAPCTNNRLRFLPPRLLIPNSVSVPPVLYWRGAKPAEAANWRAEPTCRASPGSVISTLAVIGPMPGSSGSRWPRSAAGASTSCETPFCRSRPARANESHACPDQCQLA